MSIANPFLLIYSIPMKDAQIADLIRKETRRQNETLMLIPSENHASKEVRSALSTVLTNKYSEGHVGARYYQGNKFIDEIETLAIERAKKLFGASHVNVQPYSGSPANSAIYFALLEPKDKIMGLALRPGGHLTHGHPDITFSGKYFTSVQYDVNENGIIDLDEVAKLAKKEKPQIIVVGTTAYPRVFDWAAWKKIADDVGAYFLADISHIAGLVAGGAHPSPVPYADVVMTTTHKTLRGPRGAMILVTENGLKKDPEMGKKIDMAVFPGLQGGPHDNTTAGIAVAMLEDLQPSYKKYTYQVVANAKTLSTELMKKGITLTTGGTDNHLMVLDLRPLNLYGNIVAEALEMAGMVTNRNSVPHDPNPPFYPSGVRIGTPAITTRGMKEREMKKIAAWMVEVIDQVKEYTFQKDKEARKTMLKKFRTEIVTNKRIKEINKEVKRLCAAFPTP